MNAIVKPTEDTFSSATQLWTPEQTAAVMDVHVSTLYRYISEGFPRPIKIGRRATRFVAAEVEAWIAARAAERSEPCLPGETKQPEQALQQRRFQVTHHDDQSPTAGARS
jgi:prophage regulatory protein